MTGGGRELLQRGEGRASKTGRVMERYREREREGYRNKERGNK